MSNSYGNPNKEKQAPTSKSPQKQANPKHDSEKQQGIKAEKGAPSRSQQK